MPHRPTLDRAVLVVSFLAVLIGVATVRTYRLQCGQASKFKELVKKYHFRTNVIPAHRGKILDRRFREFALSFDVFSLSIDPKGLCPESKEILRKAFDRLLHLPPSKIHDTLSRPTNYVCVKKELSETEYAEMKKVVKEVHNAQKKWARKHKTTWYVPVKLERHEKRVYPNGKLAANVIGFVSRDTHRGVEGIERQYDELLRGQDGLVRVPVNGKGQQLAEVEERIVRPAQPGRNVVLTIDLEIQRIVERELDKAMKKFQPNAGMAIVMDTHTGEILAMANRPTFDPNHYETSTPDQRKNRCLVNVYEPGSCFKPLIAAAALDDPTLGITPDTTFYCSHGCAYFGPRRLRDAHGYGTLTLREIVIKSSNIGMARVGMKMGLDRLRKAVRAFGATERTGIDFPCEACGHLGIDPNASSIFPLTTIPMGQSVTVTAMSLLTAFNAIANDGVRVKPFLAKAVTEQETNRPIAIRKGPLPGARRVISSKTSRTMRDILVGVVNEGTGRRARLDDFQLAGKTGTAQKLVRDPQTHKPHYSSSKYMSSFLAFGPADRPRITVLVTIDEPHRGGYYGGTVAAPVAREILFACLYRLGVEPRVAAKTTSTAMP